MLPEIKSKENIYTIKGSLDRSNLDIFNLHFEHIFNSKKAVIIEIGAY